jgi:hypothetical protein
LSLLTPLCSNKSLQTIILGLHNSSSPILTTFTSKGGYSNYGFVWKCFDPYCLSFHETSCSNTEQPLFDEKLGTFHLHVYNFVLAQKVPYPLQSSPCLFVRGLRLFCSFRLAYFSSFKNYFLCVGFPPLLSWFSHEESPPFPPACFAFNKWKGLSFRKNTSPFSPHLDANFTICGGMRLNGRRQ